MRFHSLATVCLVCTACAPARVSFAPKTAYASSASDYEAVYERWTRSDEAFSVTDMQDALHATATFESPEFRWAYVRRHARDRGLTPESETGLLETSLHDAQEHHRFFVTLAGAHPRITDLTSKMSAWSVFLVVDGAAKFAPESVERVLRPTPDDRVYYPSISPQRLAFRIAFPAHLPDGQPTIDANTKNVVLRFTGPYAVLDLAWESQAAR